MQATAKRGCAGGAGADFTLGASGDVMTPRQTIPLLLIAGLIVASGGRRTGSVCSSAAGCLTPPLTSPAAAVPAATIATISTAQWVSGEVRHPRAEGEAMRELRGDGVALLAEQVAVRHVVREVELDLTPEQWTALAAMTGHYQTVRQAFEATIATVSGRENLRLEIPAYPAAGDALREKFYAELRERLGEDVAAQIAQRAGAALEGYFGGFGVSVQTLDFSPG
eukprot:gene5548-7532_t